MSARNVEAIPDPVVSGDKVGGDQQLAFPACDWELGVGVPPSASRDNVLQRTSLVAWEASDLPEEVGRNLGRRGSVYFH